MLSNYNSISRKRFFKNITKIIPVHIEAEIIHHQQICTIKYDKGGENNGPNKWRIPIMVTVGKYKRLLSLFFKIWNASQICISSLHKDHANLLCTVPILVYVLPEYKRFLWCLKILKDNWLLKEK